jgi:uncharacterized Zn finger protein
VQGEGVARSLCAGGPPVTRESAGVKAVRYLAEGRLTITLVSGDTIRATARGDGQVYSLGFDLRRLWWCDCAARTDQCCHLAALRLVTCRRPGSGHG